ncbi:MAG: serine/threonine-protein kinase [Myxococcales bacterium]
MPAAKGRSPEDDAIQVTGVREAKPDVEPFSSSETMTDPDRRPPETWEPDDEPEDELPVPAGELLGGKYTVERVFAEGGMGIICLGRHVQLDQPVAIKFLRRALAGRPSIVQRFLNEARALAALRSEHVVRVMDVGQLESGRPYLVMEHLDGVELEALLERDGPLTVERAITYVLQVCQALGEAHALGIVHRDIKPENLFLWSGGPHQDTVKVLDFGLAKQLGSSNALGVTGPQDSIGSPCYMSPEQVSTPQLVDSRTDVWSLGVVLYRLLSNALPFDGDSLVEVLSHILAATPPPLSEARPGLDPKLDAIVARCLERDPNARYQTMAQLAEALNGYLAEHGHPTPAPPPVEAELRIAGLRSRWPAAGVCLLLLLSAVVYAADRSGRIRLRTLTDGWLSPARMAADAEQPLRSNFAPRLRHRASTLQAAPERELASLGPATPAAAPLTTEQIARKRADYEDYLQSHGLTRVDGAAAEQEP